MMYVEFTLSQCLEDFMRCHVNAFRYFQGVPKKIVYDNLSSVVLVRSGKDIRLNPRFEAFSGYYLFKAVLCNPRSPHEKGKVENSIKYVKSNFMPAREFKSFTDIKIQSRKWIDTVANVRIHATTHKRPVDLYEVEKANLMELADKDYDTTITIGIKSTKDCRVWSFMIIYS